MGQWVELAVHRLARLESKQVLVLALRQSLQSLETVVSIHRTFATGRNICYQNPQD